MSSRITSPGSFRDPSAHLEVLLSSPWYRALWQLTSRIHLATTKFWEQREVSAALLPITTGSVSSPVGLGSDSTPVRVELAGVDTYLADSMQFMLEIGCRLDSKGCYYVMPSFRGELADSTHLNQFFHSEAELPVDLNGIMDVVDEYLVAIVHEVLSSSEELVVGVAGSASHLYEFLGSTTPRLTFKDALGALPSLGADYVKVHGGVARSLTRKAEQLLIAEYGGSVWVTHMDHLANPFYQAFSGDGRTALNGDMLIGIGETAGCGQRHTDADAVREALRLHRVDEGDYEWYVRMRELHPLTTSGFGLGVERLLMWILNHDEIRDLVPLLRFTGLNSVP